MSSYESFLSRKIVAAKQKGLESIPALADHLLPHQQHCVEFGLRVGSWGCFLGTGLGKTAVNLEWSRVAAEASNGRALIVTPLAVGRQFEAEGRRWGYDIRVIREQSEAREGLNVINYDRLHLIEPDTFGSVALDESSILKSFTGSTSRGLREMFAGHRWRGSFTATPAPNDHMELGTQAEFVGAMTHSDMLVKFFVHDSNDTKVWRLKGHAVEPFWDWVSSWARAAAHPRDLGFDVAGYDLEPLSVTRHRIDTPIVAPPGSLFAGASSATELHAAKAQTAEGRVGRVAELVESEPDEVWIVWCDTNRESELAAAAIGRAIGAHRVREVTGSQSNDQKEDALGDFLDGTATALVTKPSIAGWGLNFQHCARMAFVGRSHSFESYYQAVRRCWRYGQTRPVQVHLVLDEVEDQIARNVERKGEDHARMVEAMRNAMSRDAQAENVKIQGVATPHRLPDWIGAPTVPAVEVHAVRDYIAINADCVPVVAALPNESIGLSVYSPPFSNLYVYSDQLQDMGNSADDDEFYAHYSYLVRELFRVTLPGRLSAVHCSDLPLTKWKDGNIGIKDLSGGIIRAHEDAGWVLHSRITIWKCPVVEMTRTKALGLLHKQLLKDSGRSRAGMPDYLLVFRKPGDNPNPIRHTADEFPVEKWQEWASLVWMTVNQTNVLANVNDLRAAKGENDEKHLCPLQLDVIERALFMWSNPGDVVLTPFMGIGSEAVTALKLGRKAIGVELKAEYWRQACEHLRAIDSQASLFAEVAV